MAFEEVANEMPTGFDMVREKFEKLMGGNNEETVMVIEKVTCFLLAAKSDVQYRTIIEWCDQHWYRTLCGNCAVEFADMVSRTFSDWN